MKSQLKRLVARINDVFGASQSNNGHESLQVGRDLTVIHVHHSPPQLLPTSAVRADASLQRINAEARLRDAQLRMLASLGRLNDRNSTLQFMRREFGTSEITELDHSQLFRVGRYMEKVLCSQASAKMLRQEKP
jgi:hypothetical protein